MGLISRKLYGLICLQLALLHSETYHFFSLSIIFSVFDDISSNIDEVLSIKPSAFGDFNDHHKD